MGLVYDITQWFAAAVDQLPYPLLLFLLFLGGLVEATPFLGILVPAHSAVFAVALQYGILHRSPWPILLACGLGSIMGDILFFVIGRKWGLAAFDKLPHWLRLRAKQQEQLRALFDAHGGKAVLLSRSQMVTRSIGPYVAGATGLSAVRFLPPAALGSLAITALVVFAGYLTGLGHAQLGRAIEGGLAILVLAVIVILALYFVLIRKYSVMRGSTLTVAVLALAGLLLAIPLARDAATGGSFHAYEAANWPRGLDALPPFITTIATWLGAINVHVLTLAFLVAFAWQARRGRWREAYTALLAGLGALAVLVTLRWRLPRVAPDGLAAAFPMTGAFPNDIATMAVALAAVLVWWSRPCIGPQWRWYRIGIMAAAALLGAAPLLAGKAWPTDVLAGYAVGGAWACLCLVGSMTAKRLTEGAAADAPAPARWLRARWDTVTAWLDLRVWDRMAWVWGLIALGIAIRLLAPWSWAVGPDADRYSAMALSFLRTGTFTMPWGDVYSPGTGPAPSHHYPPLYPIVLAGFYKVLGFSRESLRTASIILALLAMAVTYLCTRDLYGHRKGLLATAVVAVSPVLVLTTNKAYSENLLLALFVLALWGILKSLERPWFIVIGALFAGLGYLTKSSLGYFFIVAGLGGLAWRLRWRGVRVLRDPAYLTAIALFGAMVVAWGYRNHSLFGDWQTSAHLDQAYRLAFAHPLDWATLLVFSTAFILGFGYLIFLGVLPWIPHLGRQPRMASEHDSGLWLAIALPLPLTVAIDAALWLLERDFYFHNVRYVSFVLVPLTWLIMRTAKQSKATWFAILLSLGILVLGSLWYTIPTVKLENRVSLAWGPLVQDGDSATFVDTNDVYRYYFDLTADGTRTIDVLYTTSVDAQAPNATTDWLLIRGKAAPPPGYTLAIDQHKGTGELLDRITVWQRTAAPA